MDGPRFTCEIVPFNLIVVSMALLIRSSSILLLFQNEFREYPSLLRHAVSLGRRIQDPITEFAALCIEEDELLCLRLHPFQVSS